MLHATLTGAHSAADGVAWIDVYDHGGTLDDRGRRVRRRERRRRSRVAQRRGGALRRRRRRRAKRHARGALRRHRADADTSRVAWERAVHAAKARGADALTKEHGLVIRIPGSNDVLAYLADEDYDVRDVRSHAAAERHGRRQAWQLLDAIKTLPGHERAYIVTTGPTIGTRESRHVVARRPLTEAEVVGGARFPDGVALGGWPVEHHPGAGLPNHWIRIKDEGAYEIPLGTLQSTTHPNLFSARAARSTPTCTRSHRCA